MFQEIDGKKVYVVEIPEGPSQFPINDGGNPVLTPYAEALNNVYFQGLVREPGKYGIEVDPFFNSWAIHRIIEE